MTPPGDGAAAKVHAQPFRQGHPVAHASELMKSNMTKGQPASCAARCTSQRSPGGDDPVGHPLAVDRLLGGHAEKHARAERRPDSWA